MKPSTYILSSTQKWIFAVVITLAILFAGCSDSPTSESSESTVPAENLEKGLEGNWTEYSKSSSASPALLSISESQGTYRISSSDNSSDEVFMNFEYQKIDDNAIRITMTKYMVNGKIQPPGKQQEINYSLNGNTLRIFSRTFVRAGADLGHLF